MKKEITSIDVHQSAKIISLTMSVVSVLFSILGIFLVLVGIAMGSYEMIGIGVVYIFMPIIYILFTYMFTALFLWIYNMLAKKVGGIKYTVKEHTHESPSH